VRPGEPALVVHAPSDQPVPPNERPNEKRRRARVVRSRNQRRSRSGTAQSPAAAPQTVSTIRPLTT
jgi:hypothetical protein